MTRFMIALAATAASAAGLAALSTPASAQARVNEIIVFGNDPCPRSTDDEVVVCARRPESERYRLPENLRPSGPPQAGQAWATRIKSLETASDVGVHTCSPVGPGGYVGCMTQVIRQAREERRQQVQENTAPEE